MSTCRHLEFLAEEEPISIFPRFTMETIRLASFLSPDAASTSPTSGDDDASAGCVGPFTPNVPVSVPMWLAMMLRRKDRCKVMVPEWMTVDALTATLQAEREARDEFQPLPHRYREIAAMLLQYAAEDVANAALVRSLVADIENVRSVKTRKGMEVAFSTATSVIVTDIGSMEAHAFKRFLLEGQTLVNELAKLRKDLEEAGGGAERDGGVGGGDGVAGANPYVGRGLGDDDEDEDEYALPTKAGGEEPGNAGDGGGGGGGGIRRMGGRR